MKILFLCNEYPPVPYGGIGIFVKLMAEQFVLRGHEVFVLGYNPTASSDKTVIENGVTVHWLAKPSAFRRLKVLGSAYERFHITRRLQAYVKKLHPDITEIYDWSGPIVYKPPRTILVTRIHGANSPHAFFESKKISKFLYFFERRCLTMADHICAVSKHMALVTLDCFRIKRPYTVLYNPVDCEKFVMLPSVETKKNLLLYVGRIHPRKGLEELMHAFNLVNKQNPEVILEIVGPHNEKYEKVLQEILSPSAKSNVKFLGKIPHEDLPRKFAEAWASVMPSRAEAFGITAIESMACGVPVLITNKASGPEIVKDNHNGWVVNTFDPQLFAEKILQVFRLSEDELYRMKEAARLSAKSKYDLNQIVDENLKFYAECLTSS